MDIPHFYGIVDFITCVIGGGGVEIAELLGLFPRLFKLLFPTLNFGETCLRAMADNLGLEEFEDPAPSKSTVDAASTIVPTAPQNALSRRLRFRAEVDVSDRRYRGRRVTREDVELDGRSLGLLNEERISSDYEEASSLHELDENIDDENGTGSDDSTPNESLEGEDEGSLSDDGIGNAHIDPLHKKSPVPNPGQKRFDDEEHALAGRLTAAKQSDLRRAAAVQNQKVSAFIWSICKLGLCSTRS